jgi:hypothetical protein
MANMVQPRLPESRKVVPRNPELIFQKVNEILVQSSNLYRDPCSKLIQLNASLSPSHVPLKTRQIDKWPTRTDACCLHCSEPCPATPLPAVQFFDPVTSSYWISGYFCRPCCSLAFIQSDSQFNSDRTRCNMWTREVLTKFFKLKSTTAAPPRSALKKFGGPLTTAEFYGEDIHCTRFVEVHTAPFVSFAMYAEVMQSNTLGPGTGTFPATKDQNEVASDGREGLCQPLLRTDPIATQESTKQPSLLLEYLRRIALDRDFDPDDVPEQVAKTREKKILSVKARQNQNQNQIQNDDPQKSVNSMQWENKTNNSEIQQDQDIKKVRKQRITKIEQDKELKAPKTVLKRAKKMEQQEAALGNKTRSLLSYAQKN